MVVDPTTGALLVTETTYTLVSPTNYLIKGTYMNEWLKLAIYVVLAFSGAVFHYIKKRYIEGYITINFLEYLLTNRKATFNTISACVAVAYGYTVAGTDLFALTTIGGVLTGGYVADSGLNKSEETQ